MAGPVKRPYASAKREAQARATRAAIIAAAFGLFVANGYVATTVQAVADAAGVAVQTVYAVFGTKRELLRQVLEAAVVGDGESEELAEQPAYQAIVDEPDPARRAALDAELSTQISTRVAPIMKVLREAAAADPEFAATSAEITARRRHDMELAVDVLAGPAGPAMDREEAIGTLYVLYSPDVFLQLTGDFGWSVDRYQEWLADMLLRTVMHLTRTTS